MTGNRRLLGYLLRYRSRFGLTVGAAAVAATLDGLSFALFIPFFRILFGTEPAATGGETFVESATDGLLTLLSPIGDAVGPLYTVVLLIAGTILLKNAMTYASTLSSRVIEERVARDLRVSTYDHLLRLRPNALQQRPVGDLLSRMLSDVDQVRAFLSDGLQTVVRSGILVVVYTAILIGLNWQMALATVVVASVIAGCMRPILARTRRYFVTALAARGNLASVLNESIGGVRIVKAHGGEARERSRFAERANGFVTDQLRAERFALLASPLGETLGVVMFVLLLVIGASVGNGSEIRPEIFVGFAAITLRLLSPLKKLANFPALAQQADVAATRIFGLHDVRDFDTDEKPVEVFSGLHQNIRFDDVWFAYHPDRWILRGVTLEVARGEIVAIVGVSGAGKSTLIDMLPRFVDPVHGFVRFDDKPTTGIDRYSLRSQMAIVSQEVVLFNDTVRANIAYGDMADADEASIQRAARLANAHEFIMNLEHGYATVIGERGTALSGGQRQRLAIARALLRDAPLLILDEATSALDSESEWLVQEAIARLIVDRTVLIVAHRATTLRLAHRIAVLDEGRIVQIGTHEELMASGGLYQQLYAREREVVTANRVPSGAG